MESDDYRNPPKPGMTIDEFRKSWQQRLRSTKRQGSLSDYLAAFKEYNRLLEEPITWDEYCSRLPAEQEKEARRLESDYKAARNVGQ